MGKVVTMWAAMHSKAVSDTIALMRRDYLALVKDDRHAARFTDPEDLSDDAAAEVAEKEDWSEETAAHILAHSPNRSGALATGASSFHELAVSAVSMDAASKINDMLASARAKTLPPEFLEEVRKHPGLADMKELAAAIMRVETDA